MMHELQDMGQLWARCTCGHVSSVTGAEYLERTEARAQDLLLDRHNAHRASMAEQGR